MPIKPASAINFNSNTSQRSSPGVPGCVSRGARLIDVAKALLPRPPRPPLATITSWPASVRSRSTLPRSRSRMSVPGGTSITSSRPRRPWQLSPCPAPPRGARQCLRCAIPAKLSVPATARTMTSPPSPPSPPSGPPRGTYFSRRKLQQPRPPSPPLTYTATRSTNITRSAVGGPQPDNHDVVAPLSS